MYLQKFKLHRPESLNEAQKLLSESEDCALKAGGTDLLVEMKKGLRHHSSLISLNEIKELHVLREEKDKLVLGATLTHSEILESETVSKFFPGLHLAVSKIGSEQVRNSGTLGGNLCTAAACCDSAPVLIVHGAEVEMVSAEGVDHIALKDFFLHNRKTVLQKNQVLRCVTIPKAKPGTGVHFEKYTLREGSAVAVVSVAVLVVIENDIIKEASIVIGAVAPTPLVSYNAIKEIEGKQVSAFYEKSGVVQAAGKAASLDSVPIDDVRGGAQFRRDVLDVLTQRTLLTAVDNALNR